ncbi:DMT family transporter [Mesorhizobium sp. M0938]|uniref:DMT family transporter n=1 Tax=unclassified Mesorhizobium TaxID=325217 RepID=UPI00333D337E
MNDKASKRRPAWRPKFWQAIMAMVLSAACWGLATVMTKGALSVVPPFLMLTMQLSASIAFLWLAVGVTRQTVHLDKGATRLALSGVLEPGLSYGVGVPGLALTSAAAASVIGATETALVTLFAWLMLKERLKIHLLVMIAVAMGGVVLITASAAEGEGGGSAAGNLLVLLGTVFAALYVINSRVLIADVAPLPLAAMQQSVGFVFALLLLIGSWLFGLEHLPESIPAWLIFLALASGVVQYALAFWFYLIGLQVLPAGTAAAILTLIPVFGVGGAMVFLGEELTPPQWLGCTIVIAATAAMTLLVKKEKDEGAAECDMHDRSRVGRQILP